ncbi:hypothetical protein Cni_G17361 [Canna indica]|uniref:Uncharacterized protein n=1 Tax=Canna indica TaxID=4628 RepID=A0AAQ3QGP3_9LILI|nr:hypothetical protein Cni_G17361 [Canna indica]
MCNVKYEKKEGVYSIYAKAMKEVHDYSAKLGNENRTLRNEDPGILSEKNDMLKQMLAEKFLFCDAGWRNGPNASAGFVYREQNSWKVIGTGITRAGNSLKVKFNAIWYDLDNVRKKKSQFYVGGFRLNNSIKMLRKEMEIPWNLVSLVDNI